MKNNKNVFYLLSILMVLSLVASCGEPKLNQQPSDYEKLCNIFNEVLDKSENPAMMGMKLDKRIKDEIPEVYVHFQNISNADPKDAYRLFKETAEKETGKSWECVVMRKFYSGS